MSEDPDLEIKTQIITRALGGQQQETTLPQEVIDAMEAFIKNGDEEAFRGVLDETDLPSQVKDQLVKNSLIVKEAPPATANELFTEFGMALREFAFDSSSPDNVEALHGIADRMKAAFQRDAEIEKSASVKKEATPLERLTRAANDARSAYGDTQAITDDAVATFEENAEALGLTSEQVANVSQAIREKRQKPYTVESAFDTEVVLNLLPEDAIAKIQVPGDQSGLDMPNLGEGGVQLASSQPNDGVNDIALSDVSANARGNGKGPETQLG